MIRCDFGFLRVVQNIEQEFIGAVLGIEGVPQGGPRPGCGDRLFSETESLPVRGDCRRRGFLPCGLVQNYAGGDAGVQGFDAV